MPPKQLLPIALCAYCHVHQVHLWSDMHPDWREGGQRVGFCSQRCYHAFAYAVSA